YVSFVACHSDHPDLHSFPTRRSSDLATAAADPHLVANVLALDFPEVAKPEPGVGALDLLAVGADDLLEQAVVVTDAVAEARQVRSEEHTSELQSRENLVCRLLLEKKK